MDDILKLRIDSMRAAHGRTRSAFVLAVVASAVVTIVSFNVTLSGNALLPNWPEKPTELQQETAKERIKAVVQRDQYSLPLLGVQVGIVDMGLLAPFALLVFSLYFVTASRAAWSQMLSLSQEPESSNPQFGKLLQSDIVFNAVDDASMKGFPSPLVLYRILIFSPFVASASAVAADIRNLFFTTYEFPDKIRLLTMNHGDWVKLIVFDGMGVLLTFLVLRYNRKTLKYARRIRDLAIELTGKRTVGGGA